MTNKHMKNFDWTSFTKRIAVRASLANIYQAWTTKSGLEHWFLEKVMIIRDGVNLEKQVSATTSDQYIWKWFLYPEDLKGEFIQANGKDFIQFSFEGNCQVDVSLEEHHGMVIITLRQHHIPTDDQSKQYIRLGCTNGWTFYLTNLKSVYEGGIDLRNKDEALGLMLNN